jgi:hypothetical protein
MDILKLTMILIMATPLVWGQNKLEGYVLDAETKQPIQSVHVHLINGLIGTISNDEGKFKIEYYNDKDSITFSHINYLATRLSVSDCKANKGRVALKESNITLNEIAVVAKEDDAILEGLVASSKMQMTLPFMGHLYYREWVKENKDYNRFADGLLDVVYGSGDKDLIVRVNQSRTFKLPKEDDEIFEMASPVKIENVLNNQYINFLNRFTKERRGQYHFYAFEDPSQNGCLTLVIEPKKVKLKEGEDKIFHKAIIKADNKKNITEAVIELDSISNYDKNILGLKMKVLHSKFTFRFINQNSSNYLSYARADFTLQFTFRKKTQIDNYTSEFLLLSATKDFEAIPKDQRFKKNSLYKNGNKFTYPFWENLNMPLVSKEESALLEGLKSKQ